MGLLEEYGPSIIRVKLMDPDPGNIPFERECNRYSCQECLSLAVPERFKSHLAHNMRLVLGPLGLAQSDLQCEIGFRGGH